MKWQQALQIGFLGLICASLAVAPAAAKGGEQQSRLVDFSADPVMGLAPLEVSFTNESTVPGSQFTYYWDFGDGSTSTLEHPEHVYDEPGLYDVSLTIITNDQVFYNQKKDAVEAHDILMFADFDDPLAYIDYWSPTGLVSWTNDPALLGAGSMAIGINVPHDAIEMNGDDGMVVAGGGSGTGCPIPPLNCRDDVDAEGYGTFSFYFDLSGVVAGDGSYFRIFRLNEGYAEGPALVDVMVLKVGGEFFLQYSVSQSTGDVSSSLIPVNAGKIQALEITWISGKETTSGLGQFHAKLSTVDSLSSQDTSTVTSIVNLDNTSQVYDFWQIGMFDSFFYQEGSGEVVFDQFLARRWIPSYYLLANGP